jgi:peptidoglycan hydrolase-like protein with peptidoglycan-binding domain
MSMNRHIVLLAGGAMVLSACATTTLASTPPPPSDDVQVTVAPTTSTTTTTTIPATTTTTIAPIPTTTAAPVTTTTTTLPPVPVVDPPLVGVGASSGADTLRAQMRLLELGFWLNDVNGRYGITTSQAVMAFQKYYGLTTDGVLGNETAVVLSNVTERPSSRADAGTLVEIDKGLQLLFFVIDGRVEWILNTSTGSEKPYIEPDKNTPGEIQTGDSITRNGMHDVYRERPEGWWEGDLGSIYRPKYFSGGEAIHGSNHIPDYPASHGCVRISVPAMDWIWETGILPIGTPVWVHEGD